ncbi:MAG: HAD hydrolase-like protein [archaeon]
MAGAKAAGIRSALVKTGNYSPKELKKSNIKPDSVIESIAGLPKLLQKKKW